MIAPLLRALAAVDRPPRVLGPLLAVMVAVTGAAIVEAHRMPAWATPDAIGDRLFHRTFGALHLIALALGALFAGTTARRLRRDGLLDHLLLGGASALAIPTAVALRATARAVVLTALVSPMTAAALLYRDLPPSLLACAFASTAACAVLGALVGVATASPAQASVATALLAFVGYRVLGQTAADVVLAPLHASPHGTLWFLTLLTDARASTAMRRVAATAPIWVVLAAAPHLLSAAARRIAPQPSWRGALLSTALVAVPMAFIVDAVSRPFDRLAWLHAALITWTSLALVMLDDELSLLVALGGVALLGVAGGGGPVRWLADDALISAAIVGNLLVLASLVRRLVPRRGLVASFVVVGVLCVAPLVARELTGPYGANHLVDTLAGASPLGAFELIAKEARLPVTSPWREATRHGMVVAHGVGGLLLALLWFVSRRLRELVR